MHISLIYEQSKFYLQFANQQLAPYFTSGTLLQIIIVPLVPPLIFFTDFFRFFPEIYKNFRKEIFGQNFRKMENGKFPLPPLAPIACLRWVFDTHKKGLTAKSPKLWVQLFHQIIVCLTLTGTVGRSLPTPASIFWDETDIFRN